MSDMTPDAAYGFAGMWLPAMLDSDGRRHLVPGACARTFRRDALRVAALHIAAVEAEIARDMAD